jgi:hypothetical protein
MLEMLQLRRPSIRIWLRVDCQSRGRCRPTASGLGGSGEIIGISTDWKWNLMGFNRKTIGIP